jgi:hypothetical protein
MRERFFEMQEAVRLYEQGLLQPAHPNEFMITA